jgi:Fe-S cluster biogenesis protein NfuA
MAANLRDGPDEFNLAPARGVSAVAVRHALDEIRPGLVADGGNVELAHIEEDGAIWLELQGACARCAAREMTRRWVLEPFLRKQIPGVSAVLVL